MASGKYTRTAAHRAHLSRAAQIRNAIYNKTPPERFARWFKKSDTADGCWEWLGHLNWKGYAEFSIDRKKWKAHRYAWFLANGAIPDGLLVLHRCDNPKCVRPDHLFLGTHADNMHDAQKKQRKYFNRRADGTWKRKGE